MTFKFCYNIWILIPKTPIYILWSALLGFWIQRLQSIFFEVHLLWIDRRDVEILKNISSVRVATILSWLAKVTRLRHFRITQIRTRCNPWVIYQYLNLFFEIPTRPKVMSLMETELGSLESLRFHQLLYLSQIGLTMRYSIKQWLIDSLVKPQNAQLTLMIWTPLYWWSIRVESLSIAALHVHKLTLLEIHEFHKWWHPKPVTSRSKGWTKLN